MKASRGGRLTIEEFKQEFPKILQKEKSEDQITLMLMRIGIRGDCSEEQETMLFTPATRLTFGKPQTTPHKEMIGNLTYLPAHLRFVTMSCDATVCCWSEQYMLQRCFTSAIKSKGAPGSGDQDVTPQALQSQELQLLHPKQTFHDYATLQPQCKVKLPINVMCMDYWRGPATDAGDGPGGGGSPAAQPHNQSVHDGMLLFGDDQGDVSVWTFDSEATFDPNSQMMLAAAKGKIVTLDQKKVFTVAVRRRLHNDWVTRIKCFHEFRCFFSVSPDAKDSLVCGSVNTKKWMFTSASVNKGGHGVCRMQVPGRAHHGAHLEPAPHHRPAQASMKGHAVPIIDVQVQQAFGYRITLSMDKVIKVWDIRRMSCLQTLQPTEALHRPGNMLSFIQVVTTTKGAVRLFDGSNLVVEYVMDQSSARQVTPHVHPIRLVMCKMMVSLCEGSVVQVWEVNNGAPTFKLDDTQLPKDITCIGLDEYSGCHFMMIGTDDGTILLSSIEGHVMCTMKYPNPVEVTLVWHVDAPEDRFFVAGGWQCRLYVYAGESKFEATQMHRTEIWTNPALDASLETLSPTAVRKDDVMAMVLVAPHFLVYSTFRGEIYVRTMAGVHVGRMTAANYGQIPAWNRSIDKLVVLRAPEVGAGGTLHQVGAGSASLEDMAKLGLTASEMSLLTSGPGRDTGPVAHLASCGMDGMIRFWTLSSLTQVGCVDGHGASTMCTVAVASLPRGGRKAKQVTSTALFLTGDTAGNVTLWSVADIADPVVVVKWQAHVKPVTRIETTTGFSPITHDAARVEWATADVATGAADGNLRCWTLLGEYVGCFGQPVPWDLKSRATWRHPNKPHDVTEMVRPAELRRVATLEGGGVAARARAKWGKHARAQTGQRLADADAAPTDLLDALFASFQSAKSSMASLFPDEDEGRASRAPTAATRKSSAAERVRTTAASKPSTPAARVRTPATPSARAQAAGYAAATPRRFAQEHQFTAVRARG
ncbi:hypothetical protein AMAG_13235 [Allomyces macrogynus ATCC 38327]|uniref:Uncharacterized protein n=1 Tax=Allomyces macrogynus (strain ATCC 38327) TaxID=578462 RepID=A0A0L0SZY8_ALLM3|nr:hypothetical protein AMAG_13235 [Allomyces macrogynus ATCC 38327]|eukprot:KNE68062.1 hypothetical protein AMAG_13235 [Allomyces macrogynus ATCC 38327]